MAINRLTQAKVKPFREELYAKQGGRCAITHYPISPADAVLDHDHRTGHCRAVLSRGANALLGKLENNYKRYGLTLPQLIAMCKNLGDYIGRDYSSMPLHYTHRTAEEKRERTNKLARQRRAAKKEV